VQKEGAPPRSSIEPRRRRGRAPTSKYSPTMPPSPRRRRKDP
jgi:hypothetical protein